jgi:transposase
VDWLATFVHRPIDRPERQKAGVWNAQVLLRELRARGYTGGYTILKDSLQPQRESVQTVAVRRFETPPGKQAQGAYRHLCQLGLEPALAK